MSAHPSVRLRNDATRMQRTANLLAWEARAWVDTFRELAAPGDRELAIAKQRRAATMAAAARRRYARFVAMLPVRWEDVRHVPAAVHGLPCADRRTDPRLPGAEWACTRPAGHPGPHVAHGVGSGPSSVMAAWRDTDPEATPL